MRKYSSRSLSSLNGVHPDLRRVIDRALQSSPLDFAVIEGLRTKARQEQLVASGASTTMNSRHLTGHAVDLLPIDPTTGKGEFAWPLYDKLGPAVKAAAKKEGVPLIWGGDWTSFKDGPHFELDRRVYNEAKWTTTEQPAQERQSATQSKTVQASVVQGASAVGGAVAAFQALNGTAQIIAMVGCVMVALLAMFILKERLKAWASGWR
jgi:peptidoglycan L-alanyl-D-glutamate endopeptidase CwlK